MCAVLASAFGVQMYDVSCMTQLMFCCRKWEFDIVMMINHGTTEGDHVNIFPNL